MRPMTFDDFLFHETGRDIEYHIRYGTTGIDFARKAWDRAIREASMMGEVNLFDHIVSRDMQGVKK